MAKGEEQNRHTIPTPIFVSKSSATNSFIPTKGGYSQNYVADQQRLQISELQFDKFPTPSTFKFSYGNNAIDQTSGAGRLSRRF